MALTETEKSIAQQVKEQWGTREQMIEVLNQHRARQPKEEFKSLSQTARESLEKTPEELLGTQIKETTAETDWTQSIDAQEEISWLDVWVKAWKAVSEFWKEFKTEWVGLPTTKEEAFEALKVTGINLIPDAIEWIWEVIEMASNPIGTIKSIHDLGSWIIQKWLTTLWNKVTWDTFEWTEKEKLADAAWKYLSDNFGTLDKASKSITENPVDTLLVLKGIISSAKQVANPKTVKNLEKIEKSLPEKLDDAARQDVEKALWATKEKFKQKSRELAPWILERKITWTKENVQLLAETKADEFGKQIDEFVKSWKLKGTVKRDDLLDALDKIRKEWQIWDVIVDESIVNATDKFADVISWFWKDIPAEKARLIRQMFDDAVYKTKWVIWEEALTIKNRIKKWLADNIRKQLADQNPDLAKINKEFSFYNKLDEVLTETIQRQWPQQWGFTSTIAWWGWLWAWAIVFWDITWAIASWLIVKWLTEAMKSTRWKLMSANIKNKLATALSTWDSNTATKLAKDIIKQTLQNKAKIYLWAQATESNLELNK